MSNFPQQAQPVNYNPANPHVAFNQTLPAAPQMMVIPRVTKAMAFQQEWQTDLGDCFQSKDCKWQSRSFCVGFFG